MSPGLDHKLHSEVRNLIRYIDRLRREIAGIAQLHDDGTPFESMADRLDGIVESTADATETILGAMEKIDSLVDALRAGPAAQEIAALCDRINAETMSAVEACSFQDLTGQRVNKIIGSMRFVEERVNAMSAICGRDQIDAIAGQPGLEAVTDDGVSLHGPQRAGKAISQDEIDRLFD